MGTRSQAFGTVASRAAKVFQQIAVHLQRNPDAIKKITNAFPSKLDKSAEKISFATGITAMYYAIKDPNTSTKVKALMAAALAYFIMPIDVIPDWLVGIGFQDDLGVVLMVLRQVAGEVTPEHYELARRRLKRKK